MTIEALVREVAPAYRRAHLTPEQWKACQRALRRRLNLPRAATRSQKNLPDVLNADELRALLRAAYQTSGATGVLLRVLFESGMRVAELARLEIADVDLAARTIKVRSGKGGKDRLVLVAPATLEQIRILLDSDQRKTGPLFESRRAARYSVRRIQQIVAACARAAGLPKRVHPHTLRHSMATLLRNEGTPLDVIQRLLGHEDPRTTQRYVQLGLEPLRAAYDRGMTVR